tara:strand:- start:76 stop:279 length:204 start_codon:yes stop_codon:yes gene_type:complete
MVGLGRLELPTSRLSGVRSNHLSYRPESHASDLCENAGTTPDGVVLFLERETKTATTAWFARDQADP